MSTKFIKDPHEVVKAGQVVKVKVLETDVKRQRISLTMRLDDDFAQASAGGARAARAIARRAGSPVRRWTRRAAASVANRKRPARWPRRSQN